MSVIIKDMQMPEDCFSCPLKEEGYCNITNAYAAQIYKRNSDCPLIELPEHHGRLIDADAFAERIKSIIERQGYDDLTIGKFLTVGEVLNAVIAELKGTALYGYKNTPTVIEAEGTDK